MPDFPAPTVRVVDVYPYREATSGRQFLVLHRAEGHAYAGAWRMVGGKIDPGETAWAAALRELREETGMVPRRFWSLPSVNTFYDWSRDIVALAPAFAAEVQGGVTLCAEHDAYEWLPPAEAASRLGWPEQQRLLRLADALLEAGPLAPSWEIPLPPRGKNGGHS
ncbi:MAG TPA: NUDIX pyrophosphatase [Bacteroidetes bacterium]|nr:NUDIX pyrophosphatase [Bacteroidota bacterium]HIL56586.1 NUDIX pyrophosphatase [Rhodothermales bacterium]